MRKYETVFISDPDIQDQVRDDLFEKVRNIIANQDGYFISFDDWGIKKLAYDIKKKSRGHYVCVTYGGTGEIVKELERNFRLHDYVMRFMTILLSEHITMEQLEKEAEEAKTQPEEPALADDDLAAEDDLDDKHEDTLQDKDSDHKLSSEDSDLAEEISENEAENEGNNPAEDSPEEAEELQAPDKLQVPDKLQGEDK
jgi:small subunit ribosomal protein S6